jgi:hypothetical protein
MGCTKTERTVPQPERYPAQQMFLDGQVALPGGDFVFGKPDFTQGMLAKPQQSKLSGDLEKDGSDQVHRVPFSSR